MHPKTRKACESCKSAKRKCTKQLPQCRRCELRGLACSYEEHPRMVVYGANDNVGGLIRLPQHHDEQVASSFLQPPQPEVITIDPQLGLELPTTIISPSPSLDDLRSAWFLTPGSWEVSSVDTSRLVPISGNEVRICFDKTKDWLNEWIETGSNPFIHPELNKKSVPSCVQDAFMALSTYFNKTDKTSDMVYRFIEDKANKLAVSHDCPQASIVDEIGRVQSLFIYTFIRLFDGNIRQRHYAEQHLPILHRWAKQMLSHASCATSDDRLLLHNALTVYTPELTSHPPVPCQASPEQLLWHAWILSESVRRTWCVSMMIQSGYELLKTGSGPCFGGVRITTRRGVWDAKTAAAWTSICAERSVGFLHRSETEVLLEERSMDEVDVFPLVLMGLDFGPDRMERWRNSGTR
ncbi:hypothetical protein LCI18_001755 [Fusarium solani-melongenae]|uniref:Uncharacterized protein n=1 Tax=Fusarium solani subsp. cucurbitae TaxID=2747967 RepID=A0ACD3YPK3_FUSSC|nr:hypothetical protein LCI18_001755 [Fusarium solani-melongenae]